MDYIETLDGKVLIINAGKGNPNRASDGRFTYGPGGSEGSSLTELYTQYPAMEKTLDKMDAVNATFKQSELDHLKKIRNISDKKESTASSAVRAREAELDKQGKRYDKGGNDATSKDAEYRRLDAIYQKASKESSKGFNKWRDYKLNKERTKTKLKEDLYESTYGKDWEDKYNTAHETLREWARNEYGKSKKKMVGENYGSLELEHALTQAHYLRNGQKEVEVYWGLYGKAAEGVISGKGNIRKDITSVTNSKEIAESYARMSRMTSGTKRHITNRSSAFPLNGVIVTAKIPVNKIIVSHEISANTWHEIYNDFKVRKVSPGAFLQDQLELIIDVPSKADTSNYKIIPTHSSAIELREAIMSGKTWSEVI